jgi:hypothetical protein
VDGYALEDDMARYLQVISLLTAVGRYDAVRKVMRRVVDGKTFEREEEKREKRRNELLTNNQSLKRYHKLAGTGEPGRIGRGLTAC